MANPIASACARLLPVPKRLQNVVYGYLLSLMLHAVKNTQRFAADVTGLNKSQFSRLLSKHQDLAIQSLKDLSMQAARAAARDKSPFVAGTPWTVAILIDATLHPRSSLHVHNAQRHNHGEGFVIGHQWTNIVLLIGEQTIPLPPIPFLSRKECKRRGVEYRTEHEALTDYLESLQLSKWIGFHDPSEIVVITDSGYDGKKLQRAILAQGWDLLTSIRSNRSAQTSRQAENDANKYQKVSELFRSVRKQAPWETVRVTADGGKRKEFRARRLIGRIRGLKATMTLVCSEKPRRIGRMYFVCSNTQIPTGALIRAYRRRWEIEMFHRVAKQQLGMLDAGVHHFDSMISHIHWVYCAYILLHQLEMPEAPDLLSRQRKLLREVLDEPWRDHCKRIIKEQTRYGGRERTRALCLAALRGHLAS